MTGTGAKKLSQISWSTSSTGYPRIDTRIDTKTTQGKPVVFSSIFTGIFYFKSLHETTGVTNSS